MKYSGESNLKVLKLADNYNRFLVKMIMRHIRCDDKIIVDFGSGDGYFSKEVETITQQEVICIEPAYNLQKYYHDKKVFSSIDQLPDNSVDFLYSLNVLEHMKNDVAEVEKIYNKMKPSGLVYIYVPALMFLYTSMDDYVGHYRRYSKADLYHLFDANKWEIKDCRYADFGGFFATLFFKIFSKKKRELDPHLLAFYDKWLFPISRFLDIITFGRFLGKNLQLITVKKQGD